MKKYSDIIVMDAEKPMPKSSKHGKLNEFFISADNFTF